MSADYYSIWLVPQESDFTYFQSLISTLAKRFGTVPFCPHVTLYSGPLPTAVDVQQVLAALAAGPITLEVVNLNHGPSFAKTLYVQLKQTALLNRLVNFLISAIPNAQPSILDPHLSLLYHSLDVATQQTLTANLTLPRPTIRFNQVQAIAAPPTFETQDHVARLRCVCSQLLTTP